MKKLTQDLYDKIKAQPSADWQELRDKYNISKTTIMRIRSSATLEESKAKGRHKTTDVREEKPSIVRTTENKKSVIKTTITGGKAKIEIIPKRSLLSRIFRIGK